MKDKKKSMEETQNEEQSKEMDNEEESEEKSCAKKSEDLTEDDLEKSIAKLTEYQEQNDAPTRKQTLLEKAQNEELTKSEQDELHALLGGGESAPEETLADEVEKSMEPDEHLQKALDVSDFLSSNHDQNVKVVKMLAETIEKSDNRQHEFNLLLAKSLATFGNLVKSMDQRLEGIEGQPVRGPKSQQAKPLSKGFAGTPPPENHMSKSEVISILENLVEKSCEAGQAGVVDGVDLVKEISKSEMMGQISQQALAIAQKKRSAVH